MEFNWNPKRQTVFEDLKLALSKAPILSPPDWEKEFHVTLYASGWCLGAILWQYDSERRECPIYYASRQMSQAETKYSTTEREALAVIYACKKFRHYLLGYRIVFHMDHDSLKYLVNEVPDLSRRIARWILLLQEFAYEVVVKSEKSNANADFLSRQRGMPAVKSLIADFSDEFQDSPFPESVFHVEGEDVSEFQEIITYLTERKYPEGLNREEKSVFQSKVAPYSLIQGILFKMEADDTLRRCLEQKDQKRVMTALHSESLGGHFAAITTVNRIRSAGYWWPHLIRDVRRHVGSCDQCQRTGTPSFRNHWPLTPIIPLAPFEKWRIDFVGPFNPASARKKKYHIGHRLCHQMGRGPLNMKK